jgi:hypothetical protein
MSRVARAITLKPELFAVAAAEPDLDPVRDELMALLSRMASKMLMRATTETNEVRTAAAGLPTREDVTAYACVVVKVKDACAEAERSLKTLSYAGCFHHLANISVVRSAISRVRKLNALYDEKSSVDGQLIDMEEVLTKQEESGKPPLIGPNLLRTLSVPAVLAAALVAYAYAGRVVATVELGSEDAPLWEVIVGPLYLLFWLLVYVLGFAVVLVLTLIVLAGELLIDVIFRQDVVPAGEPLRDYLKMLSAHQLAILWGLPCLWIGMPTAIYAAIERTARSIEKKADLVRSRISEKRSERSDLGARVSEIQGKIDDELSAIRRLLVSLKWHKPEPDAPLDSLPRAP